MIAVENIKIYNLAQAVYDARNAMNSWDRSDSDLDSNVLGENDLDLAKRLIKAGPEHRKWMRQVFIHMNITAPCYWISEFDTYKIGTTKNSCSFMHKGLSKPFDIHDFSVMDKRVYDVLSPLPKKEYALTYNYETEEYKTYTTGNGRKYKVFKNGRVFSEAYDLTDTYRNGRTRHFEEKECEPSKTRYGYYELKLGGTHGEKWMLHRLVAFCWVPTDDPTLTVNHIDGNKGNNCAENLEWCTIGENAKKGFKDGLYENVGSDHANYIKWKRAHIVVPPEVKLSILAEKREGKPCKEIAERYGITLSQLYNITNAKGCEDTELFNLCYFWERIIKTLNDLRDDYLETKDSQVFQAIRCLLPQGYNQTFTVTMNYEVALNMIKQRHNHRLEEWRTFCGVIMALPYMDEFTL